MTSPFPSVLPFLIIITPKEERQVVFNKVYYSVTNNCEKMGYSKQIREALKRAEFINVRGEVSIPLYRLKKELEKRNIPQKTSKIIYSLMHHVQIDPKLKMLLLRYTETI